MSAYKKPISKISRPSLPKVFQRRRLFELLDKNRKHPIIWVSGPAGAGKTTSIASYLESFEIPYLWYQIDARDADPATFFYYMSLAVKQARPGMRKPLPLLTPEYMQNPDAFSLQYFEIVYQYLKPPIMIVIDNYHLIPADSILHSFISSGLSIIPDELTAILISRESPPPTFSRMMANREFSHLGWRQIQLTPEETAGIVRLQAKETVSEATIRDLHNAAGGWAAGLMLMLAQVDMEGIDWRQIKSFTPQEIFDYFGMEIFEREPADIQDFLLRTALLPDITINLAKTLTGHPRAGGILSELNRCNRFTDKRQLKRLSYQFHPLFREFLLSRAKTYYSKNKLNDLRRTAAGLLQDEGDPEAAAGLLRDAGAWDALSELILSYAPVLSYQGRNKIIFDWISSLPDEVVQNSGWLLFWLGSSKAGEAPGESLNFFKQSYQLFKDQQDATGIVKSWCALELGYFLVCSDYTPLDQLIEDVFVLLPEISKKLPPELSALLGYHIFSALNMRQPQHPQMERYAEQVDQFIMKVTDPHQQLWMGARLLLYRCVKGEFRKMPRLIDTIGPLARDNTISPFIRLVWLACEATYAVTSGEFEAGMKIVAEGEKITKKTGVQSTAEATLLNMGAYVLLRKGDYKKAGLYLDRIDKAILPGRFFEYAFHRMQQALYYALQKKFGKAMENALYALDLSLQSGSPFLEHFYRFCIGQLYTDLGNYEKAAEELTRAENLGQMFNSPVAKFMSLIFNSQLQFKQGNEEAGIKFLKDGLALARERGYYFMAWDRYDVLTDLYAKALKMNIEVEHVREGIRRTNISAYIPSVTIENWPWPIKIYTLGRFSILQDDTPIRFSTKAQKKPLEMIKVLIALGGRDVNKVQVSDILWPDAEGDKADQAFFTTLHRLRHFLGNDQAVLIQDGKLSLNPAYCWVDCWTFERLLSRASNAFACNEPDNAIAFIQKALAIYHGAFLAGDEWASWLVSRRERLRSKFLLAVNRLCSELESQGQWDTAVDYYHRSLDVDDLSETTYQRLMKCFQHMGQESEAISVYKRCQETLTAAMNLAPSAETQAIYRSLIDRK